MARRSAGLLLYRRMRSGPEVFLVHPGGPFWAKKDDGAWSVPKGLVEDGEDELAAARRETREEIGFDVDGDATPLGECRQPGGKIVVCWAVEADVDVTAIVSNTFQMEWPPKSGRFRDFPEVDRAGWFDLATARTKILEGQSLLLDAFARQVRFTIS